MKKIPLTQGKFALVDDEDYEFLVQRKWHVVRGRGTFYASTHVWDGIFRKSLKMHRVILRATDNQQGDHVDGNGLNNQKYNLRLCTNQENQANAKLRKDNFSGYKGVSWHPRTKKWMSQIGGGKNRKHLGYYFCLITAAKVYDVEAVSRYGDFARPNFPTHTEALEFGRKTLKVRIIMEYVIKWRSKITGESGEGTTRFSKQDATEEVASLNRKWPNIKHWYEDPTRKHNSSPSDVVPYWKKVKARMEAK